jgi:hypothetical protein
MKASKKKVTLKQRAKKAGIPAQLVYNRMHDGWSEKKALSVPVRKRAKSKKVKKVEPRVIMEPKVAYKVEPSEVQRSGSRVKKPIAPLPIQKFEAPKSRNWQIYVIVVLAVVLIVAIVNT